jgi:DNA integrity scanning protein DisA with diadenylate cyclase activity
VLIQYWNVVADAVAEAGGQARLVELARQGRPTAGLLNITKAVLMIEKAIGTIAHLAGIDGAIVFTSSLRIGAFNAIIDRTIQSPTCFLADIDGKAIDENDFLQHRGSRHQSALLYTKSIPGSFAFVISQDGSVSAFHNKDGTTVIYQTDMRVLE